MPNISVESNLRLCIDFCDRKQSVKTYEEPLKVCWTPELKPQRIAFVRPLLLACLLARVFEGITLLNLP
jgi:hypothetical protein